MHVSSSGRIDLGPFSPRGSWTSAKRKLLGSFMRRGSIPSRALYPSDAMAWTCIRRDRTLGVSASSLGRCTRDAVGLVDGGTHGIHVRSHDCIGWHVATRVHVCPLRRTWTWWTCLFFHPVPFGRGRARGVSRPNLAPDRPGSFRVRTRALNGDLAYRLEGEPGRGRDRSTSTWTFR